MADPLELHGRLADGQVCELRLSSNSFILTIPTYGVDARLAFNRDTISDPLIIQLANGKSATLQNNYYAGHGGHIGVSEAFLLRRIGANRVIIGPRPFEGGNVVSSIRFKPTNELIAQYYLGHRGHVRLPRSEIIEVHQLFARESPEGTIIVDAVDPGRALICEIQQGAITISLEVVISENFSAQGGRVEEARFTKISYGDPVPIELALKDVMCLCDFYSMMIGEVVIPQNIGVASGAVGEYGRRPTFEVHAAMRTAGSDLDSKEAVRCLMSAQIDGPAYQESLGKWFERRGEWCKSYDSMAQSLGRQGEITRHRYLDALNWFEAIPNFYSSEEPDLRREVIGRAAAAAHHSFQASGIDVSEERIYRLLAPLNAPSLGMRLRAAVTHIRKRFGLTTLPSRAENLISRIVATRGTLAHGNNNPGLDEARDFYELTLLVEAICSFLTLSALPWELRRLEHAHYHPLQSAVYTLRAFDVEHSNGAANTT